MVFRTEKGGWTSNTSVFPTSFNVNQICLQSGVAAIFGQNGLTWGTCHVRSHWRLIKRDKPDNTERCRYIQTWIFVECSSSVDRFQRHQALRTISHRILD